MDLIKTELFSVSYVIECPRHMLCGTKAHFLGHPIWSSIYSLMIFTHVLIRISRETQIIMKVPTDRLTDWRTDELTDGQNDRPTDGQTDGQSSGWTDVLTSGHSLESEVFSCKSIPWLIFNQNQPGNLERYGLTDGRTDGQTEQTDWQPRIWSAFLLRYWFPDELD